MSYTVVDEPSKSYTVADAPAAMGSQSPAGVPGWAMAIGSITGLPPELIADPSQSVGFLKELARQGGLTARYALEGLSGIADPINLALGLKPAAKVTGDALSKVGLPEPQGDLENFVGDVSRGAVQNMATMGAGGAMRTAAAPVVAGVGRALQVAPGSQLAATAAGSAAGSVGNRQLELSPAQNLFFSLAMGAAIPSLGTLTSQVAQGTGRGLKAIVQPFTQGGQQKIVGQTLNRLAENPDIAQQNIADAQTFVPGSEPTTGQASSDPGLLNLERRLASDPESGTAFTRRAAEQTQARNAMMEGIAGTSADLKAAEVSRTNNANADYATAYQAGGEITPSINRQLKPLMDRPVMKQAWDQGVQLAANKGMRPQDMDAENPEFLHFVKLSLDDIIQGNATTALGRNAKAAAIDTQHKFLDVLDNISPLYGIARGNYAEASAPINQMQTLQDIFGRAELAPPDMLNSAPLSQAKWKNLVTKNQTDLLDTLTPEQMNALHSIGSDLDRASLTANVGRAVGSNTVQQLATGNMLAAAGGNALSNNPLARMLTYPVTKAFEWSGANTDIRNLLDKAMLDPNMAARLMAAAPNFNARMTLAKLLALKAHGIALGGTLGATEQAAQAQ